MLTLTCGLIPILFTGTSCGLSQDDRLKEKQEKDVIVNVETSRRAWLGLSLSDMTKDLAKEHGIKTDEGAYVRDVIEDSPAEKAGFEEGDVVLEFNGRTIYDADDLTKAVRKTDPGATAKVVVLRKGQKKAIEVKLGKTPRNSFGGVYSLGMPAPHAWPGRSFRFLTSSSEFSGLSLMTLNPQLAEYFDVPGGEGVLVERVKKGSAGAKAGFKAGDVILKFGETEVSEAGDVWEGASGAEKQEKAQVDILRKGKKQTLTMAVDPSQWKMHGHSHAGDADEDLNIRIREPEMQFERQEWKTQMDELQRHLRGMGREISTHMREAQRNLREALRESSRTTL